MMTFDVEVLLKGTDEVVTETVTYDGPEPAGWTDTDVREVLLSNTTGFSTGSTAGTEPVGTRCRCAGLSWIVTDADPGVAIAIENSEWRSRRRAVRAAGRRVDTDESRG